MGTEIGGKGRTEGGVSTFGMAFNKYQTLFRADYGQYYSL